MNLMDYLRIVPDFPNEGIMFVDIMPLLGDSKAFSYAINSMHDYLRRSDNFFGLTKVASIEARGYPFGSLVAWQEGVGQALIRKPGKLPGNVVSKEYALEYGTNKIEMQRDAIKRGEAVLLVDDLLATGGTVQAAAELIKELDGNVVGACFLVELTSLKGREKLEKKKDVNDIPDIPVFSVVQYTNEGLEEQYKSQQAKK